MLKKIVVIGPESTGKSTLCEKLAAHYNTQWVKEYAREYLLKNGTDYTYDNLIDIAKAQIGGEEATVGSWQLANEQSSTFNVQPLFIDTDMYVMKVWCEFVFGKCHHGILNQIARRPYALYLLCDVDLPWVKDELREYPDLASREKLFHHYKDIMVNQQVPCVIINGSYEERLEKAIVTVDLLRMMDGPGS